MSGESTNGGGQSHNPPDARVAWVLEVVSGHFRTIKPDKMRKFASADETVEGLLEFLDGGSVSTVWFAEAAGTLTLAPAPPKKLRAGTSVLHFTKSV